MTNTELKRLSRRELLEMLIEQGRENDRLKEELRQANEKLESRKIIFEKSGTLAEAAIAINDVLAAADAAAAQYLENIKRRTEEIQQADYDRIIAEAEEKAATIVADAEAREKEVIEELNAQTRQDSDDLPQETHTEDGSELTD